ncbi:DUF952 domain-containing protein [Nocardia macrotermitis]|uniref:Glutathione S-transferase n=1 Tax=Nocardia macrotermitis TaxID=2585198 RepID=A0A7K0CVR5_9NOCA|nr:DUF952 domain-containing protein [Nocardia macrotermitis]MQY17587.1 hypothetical protein [Nocardia macrotermitis]
MDAPDTAIPNAHKLVHMCTRDEWDRARAAGDRRPESLEAEGFVHLSAPRQVHLPANRLFSGRDDVVLLWLDPELLGAPVKWEPGVPSDPESMRFPHLYGPLPTRAVVSVSAYRPGPDGSYPELSE